MSLAGAATGAPAPRPLLLAAAGHTCAAWWHAPAPDAAPARLAVVLASSWGQDDMSAYVGLRALALRLADAGLGVLRFEWADAGDSSAPTGTTGVAEALAAFAAAADAARARSGGARLAFVGLRLGALLAAHAAAARDDVDGLVALLPVATGNAFVREQILLGASAGLANDADGGVQLAGFVLPPGRAAEIAALRWPLAAAHPMRAAWLLDRPGMRCRQAVDALHGIGAGVRESAHADLDKVIAKPHEAELAGGVIDEIVHGLGAWAAEAAPCAAVAMPVDDGDAWLRVDSGGVRVRERLVAVPAGASADAPALAAVLVEPDAPRAGARRGVVLLSSAQERRIGPHRLLVSQARKLAANGDVVLRLDIAGVGDSPARATPDPDAMPLHYDPRCVDDVRRAVAWLREGQGVGECVLAGLCSGAHHAWRAALAGVDVQRVVLVNQLVFHWKRGVSLEDQYLPTRRIKIAARTGRAIFSAREWRNLLGSRANMQLFAGVVAARAARLVTLRVRDLADALNLPLRGRLALELEGVCRRGVVVNFVFGSDEPGLVLLKEEIGHTGVRLARDRCMKVCEVEHADHTFAGTAGRAGLYAVLDTLLKVPAAADNT